MSSNQEKPFDKPLKKDQTSISASKTLAIPKEKLDFTRADPRIWQNGEVIEGLYEVRDMTSGGMGVVYFVNHKKWNTMLAVKSPNLKMIGDERNVRRFIREAETWVDLGKHPNIATCFYVRIIEGLPRIFVEYVDGGSLNEWIGKGQPEKLEDILDIAIQISEGMAHAHNQKNLIHRDLKPANVLMTKDETAKITDFGLVRRSGEVEMSRGEKPVFVQDSIWETVTVTGTRVGTPAYMSPEQWSAAHEAGREADIYSFGIMLYEMLCGRRPFELTEQEREMHPMAQVALFEQKHREKKVPVITRGVPANLSRLVMKCIEKSPDNRYHSFEELRERLKSIYQEVSGREYPRRIASEVELKADDLNNRALSLIDLKQEGEAVKCWEEALRLNPNHTESVFNYGYWQWRNVITTYEQYIDWIKSMENKERNNPVYWHSLGLIHLEKGDLEESLQAIKKSLELGFKDASVLNAMGLAYLGLEDFENAKKTFMEAVAIHDTWRSRLSLAETLYRIGDEQACREEISIILHNPLYKNVLEIHGITDENKAVQYVKKRKIRRTELIKTLTIRTNSVNSVAFSPDGKYVLTIGYNEISGLTAYRTARLWDITTSENIRTHSIPVISVAFLPEGRYVLIGDETAWLWDIKTGENIKTITMEGARTIYNANSVAFSPDGKYVLIAPGQYCDNIQMRDINTGDVIKTVTLEGLKKDVRSITFSPDCRYALTGNGWGRADLWDLTTLERALSKNPVISVLSAHHAHPTPLVWR
jgi:serine/threonine protein kinase